MMVFRGIIYSRSWRPPTLFVSSLEEIRAMDEDRIRRRQRWYNWGRGVLIVALIGIFLFCAGIIINYYVNYSGESLEQSTFNDWDQQGELEGQSEAQEMIMQSPPSFSGDRPPLGPNSGYNDDPRPSYHLKSPIVGQKAHRERQGPSSLQNLDSDQPYEVIDEEAPCLCPVESFVCGDCKNETGNWCIESNLVCDGTNDCQNGFDESSCVTLSTNLHTLTENKTSDFMSGFVLLRVRDEWHPYCSNDWSKELATAICRKELDYRKLVEMKLYELEEINSIQRQGKEKEVSEDENVNLLILEANEDLKGKYEYNTNNGKIFEKCFMAFIHCSNL